jgi:flavin reductase (DIM6/NTAB) family NADH-FMN oxidoreductase RutF
MKMVIDYKDKELTQKYQLMAQTIVPRPIAWIVTESENGLVNIAPFSYFIGLSSDPATVLVSIGHKKDGTPKDTLKNIREQKRCTICFVEEEQLKPMHSSSKELDFQTSEAEYFNIETENIIADFPPIVKGIPSAFFCTFNQEIVLEGSKTIPLVLNVEHQYIDERCIEKDQEKFVINFSPVARIGKSYALLGAEITPLVP